ncbi:MAG: DUF4926 domain-containing protein [Betaproteobacteria bacterium]|nr:DUF4926 domain-containing protein [Betaproteobacteria bacterium]
MKLLDVVALLHDVPVKGLSQGQVGTVVEDLGGGVFEVEFADLDGRTYALAPLASQDVLILRHEPILAAA